MRPWQGIAPWLFALALASCSKPADGPAPGQRAVPVSVAKVNRLDIPIFLEGLGNVVAFQTVTVRSLVDGQLREVFFREGQAVRRGDPLAQIDPRPFLNQLHQAEAALARDKALLATNRRDLERYQALAQRKLISQQQADNQSGLVEQGAATVHADQAAVDSARLNLTYARIVSPIDGITGIRSVDPGNVVHASDTTGIVVVTQLDPIAVLIALPQDVLAQVAEQQSQGQLEVRIFNRDGKTELGRGNLEVIDNLINPSTSTLRLKAVLPNPKHVLWPNAFVKARILLTTRRDALVVPAAALQRGPNSTIVYVLGQDQTVQSRPVTVDLLQGDQAIITQGLQAGEAVVTEGQSQLRPGSKVAPRPMENPSDGGIPENAFEGVGGSPRTP
ncbi:efflux RND transporter periplasmic adaptor subunit [Stigmatella aurantiaca]|uniref:Membrane-fusion protein n=1 Tax=Stigmatella aurantiaca (strain DW4/3-1) TaxID=378806 RepID=Q08VD6_STIAD|nr:efflux RND transporter periplasmic adaptor subunit [Stigmatella aurantiaca]ADO70956.1 Secretion protein [Stigmatella aurantiaca DW4/3-1]EAU64424.1 membrane-fusion protein [Stigmatella aurantiaca DW4/3-1]